MTAKPRHWVRQAHRWLGLLIGVQLLLWTVSGLFFSVVPIEAVRGETRVREQPPPNFAFTPLVSPADAIEHLVARTGPSVQVRQVALRRVLDEPVYELRYQLQGENRVVLADARSGALRPPLGPEQAREVARRDFAEDAAIAGITLVEQVAAGDEYRGGPLPAWRVDFNDAHHTSLYVAAELGTVAARRNRDWRLWDFMWMLHILDFEEREDFNTLLLQIAATLGIITIISGVVLWFMTTSLFRSRA